MGIKKNTYICSVIKNKEVNMKTFVIVYSNRMYKDHFKVAAKSFKDALKTAIIFYKNSNCEILGIIEEEYFHL